MKSNNCNIVLDLLPNYIEGLTSRETNDFVASHLLECEKCNKKYNDMKDNIDIPMNQKDDKQVSAFKKIHKKFNILKISLILTLAISLSIMTYYYFYMRKSYSNVVNDMVQMVEVMNKNGITFNYDENGHITGIVPITNSNL